MNFFLPEMCFGHRSCQKILAVISLDLDPDLRTFRVNFYHCVTGENSAFLLMITDEVVDKFSWIIPSRTVRCLTSNKSFDFGADSDRDPRCTVRTDTSDPRHFGPKTVRYQCRSLPKTLRHRHKKKYLTFQYQRYSAELSWVRSVRTPYPHTGIF